MIFATIEIVSNLIEVDAEIVNVTIGGSCGGDYEIYVNGNLDQSGSSVNLTIETFNITA